MPTWKIKSKISVLLFAAAAMSFAQTAADLESPAVNRVAEKLNCNCGCKQNLACRMDPYPCGTCRKAKEEIFTAQAAGKSDQQVIDQFVSENGKDIVAIHPGFMGIVGPYAALGLGLAIVILFMRRIRSRPQPAAESSSIDPAVLDRIEKDLSKLD